MIRLFFLYFYLSMGTVVFGQNLVGFFSGPSGPQLGTISTDTGAVSLIGSPMAGVSSFTSKCAIDTIGNRFFFIGTPAASMMLSIYTVDMATGTVGTPQALSDNLVADIAYHQIDDVVLGIFFSSGRQLGTIDETNGNVSVFPALDGGAAIGFSFTRLPLDDASNTLYFRGENPNWNLYSINTQTGAGASVILNPDQNWLGWEWDEDDNVLFALYISGANRQLGTINPATGVVTNVGAAFPVDSSSSVSAMDPDGNVFYLNATVGGVNSLVSVETNTGTASNIPLSIPTGFVLLAMHWDPGSLPVDLFHFSID